MGKIIDELLFWLFRVRSLRAYAGDTGDDETTLHMEVTHMTEEEIEEIIFELTTAVEKTNGGGTAMLARVRARWNQRAES